jgi:hypothetical protein
MTEQDYSNREIDSHFAALTETLARIETQVLKTNGRVNKLERNMLVISCVVGTILLLKYPEVIKAIQLFL